MKNLKFGVVHFLSHFITEIITFVILTNYMSLEISIALVLLYDFLAFVPQGIYGYFIDKKIKIPFYGIAILFLLISSILFNINANEYLVIVILSIGNVLIHIVGAESTIRVSEGKLTNVALFVSGGSFGVVLGKLFANNEASSRVIIALSLFLVFIEIFNIKHKKDATTDINLEKYNYSNKKINPILVIILATLVVSIRALIGYAIPTSWNKETYQLILLFFFMGIGKALGGILIDTIGIKITSILSTLVSIPLLIFGENIMIVSILGVMLFSMTMAITLAIIISNLKKYPGIAFGCTTLGLFIGTFPIFVINFNHLISIILVISLSILSFIILLIISKEKKA